MVTLTGNFFQLNSPVHTLASFSHSCLSAPRNRTVTNSILLFFSLGLGNSSAVGPDMVGQLATAFLDALYKA